MKSLVGYTGFVGSNIVASCDFDYVYNSKNISDAFATNPDLLVYAGVRAEMFLANKMPEKDFEQIKNAIENIVRINPKFLVLISTVSVYGENCHGDENTGIDKEPLAPYGKNRLHLENWVESNLENYLIVRLPALYGKNLKKNFIYDYINFIPQLLKEEKFLELCKKNSALTEFYENRTTDFTSAEFLAQAKNQSCKN